MDDELILLPTHVSKESHDMDNDKEALRALVNEKQGRRNY